MVSLSDGKKHTSNIFYQKEIWSLYTLGRLPWYDNKGYSSKGKEWTTNNTFVIGIAFIGFNCVYWATT